jgi:hypothetical protein
MDGERGSLMSVRVSAGMLLVSGFILALQSAAFLF